MIGICFRGGPTEHSNYRPQRKNASEVGVLGRRNLHLFGFRDRIFGFSAEFSVDMKIGRPGKWKFYSLLVFAGAVLIGATPARTTYSDTANKELKPRVMRLVKDIRELVYAHKKQDGELMATFDKRDRVDATKDERKRVREQWIRDSDTAHDSFMREYKEKYWADALLLRNELLRRLPKQFRQPQLAAIYQYPTNLLGVEAIADNLELLAKSLPDK